MPLQTGEQCNMEWPSYKF